MAEEITHPIALIHNAIEKGIAPDDLGKLLDLQERWERNQAAAAYAEAISAFQSECPTVFKRRKAGGSGMSYAFASYDDVMREAGPILAKHKIAVTFSTDPADHGIRITCRVRVGIHYEDSTLTMPIPEMKINDTQKHGAALSYLKRYAICAALNIVVTDEDNDAQGLSDTINREEQEEIMRLVKEKDVNLARFLAWAGVKNIVDILRRDYAKVLDTLKRKNGKAVAG